VGRERAFGAAGIPTAQEIDASAASSLLTAFGFAVMRVASRKEHIAGFPRRKDALDDSVDRARVRGTIRRIRRGRCRAAARSAGETQRE
jgi:hypothetical protein